jgi:hypothetical protein
MVKEGKLQVGDTLSELGIYSVIFTRNVPTGNELIENRTIGTVLRTKRSCVNEGGVVSGYSVVDQPLPIPTSELKHSANKVVGTVNF